VIYVDDRIGSVHYAKSLVPLQIERLEYGDICFEGANNQLIGIEVKKISDAISSLLSGRLADHQLPGMLALYDHRYLVVEGYYRPNPESGLVQIWRGGSQWRDQGITWQSLEGWLTTMETVGGLRLRRTTDARETVATVMALYHWWQKEDHKSLHVFNTAADAAAIDRPGLLRRMAAQLPLIGWERSVDVAKHFGTVPRMVNATIGDWMEIDGIGKGIAIKVVKALQG